MKLFLSITFLTVAFVVTHCFTIPTKIVPDSVIENLLGSTSLKNRNGNDLPKMKKMKINSLPLHLQASFRASHENHSHEGHLREDSSDNEPDPSPAQDTADDEDDQCGRKNGRAITIASDYYGSAENVAFADPRNHFMKFALGMNEKQIEESGAQAISYLKIHFGVSFNGTQYDPESGVYYDPMSNISTAAVIFEEPLRIVSDSQQETKCADTTAVLGGWLASGEDVFVRGLLHPEGKIYNGQVLFFMPFLAFAVGTPFSNRLFMYPIYPLHCPLNGACALSGIFFNVDDGSSGWYDGLSMNYQPPGYKFTNVMRISLMSPGRFTPGLDAML